MNTNGYTCLIVLGPTAVGKTALAVRLAAAYNGEVISADSRQVYRGLDIGSGKDLCEFTLSGADGTKKEIPYHLIDVADLSQEYSVFNYQQDFYRVFAELAARHVLPVICGGTGMYLDAVVRGYDLVEVPVNQELRADLAGKTLEELSDILRQLKQDSDSGLHNHTDTDERHRVLRAIEIETYRRTPEAEVRRARMPERPDIRPFIIGTTFPRDIVRRRVRDRLRARIKEGMIEEVELLHKNGASWERLERLGLEYRFAAWYLQGKIRTKDELFRGLSVAIGQFVKRQETWFRGMERKGVPIHWLPYDETDGSCRVESRVAAAQKCIADERCHFCI